MTTPNTGGRSYMDDAAALYCRLVDTADAVLAGRLTHADLELVATLQDAADVLREILPDNADQCEHVYCYREWTWIAAEPLPYAEVLGHSDLVSRLCSVHAADVAPYVHLTPRLPVSEAADHD